MAEHVALTFGNSLLRIRVRKDRSCMPSRLIGHHTSLLEIFEACFPFYINPLFVDIQYQL